METYRVYYGPDKYVDHAGPGLTGEDARGVQVILQHHPDVNWYTQSGADFYVWREDRWVGVDVFGLVDYLLDSGVVMLGRTVTNSEFQAVMDKVIEDRDWGRKNGFLGRNRERVTDATT